jgi:BlaI family penicillinase repressor
MKTMQLTRAEEQVMQILWDLEEGLVKDIRERFNDPKPARNTVSTVVRILEKKGYVDHKSYGNVHLYFPVVSRDYY